MEAKKKPAKPAPKRATKEKGPRAHYNDFHSKFLQKPGNLGSLVKNAAGQQTFSIHFDSLSDTEEAIAYLKANGAAKEVFRSTVDKRSVMFIL